MIVYYQYCSFPKKGRNPSYQKFKIQHLPFPWDKISRSEDDEITIDREKKQEEMISPNEWLERIKTMKETGKADLKELDGKI